MKRLCHWLFGHSWDSWCEPTHHKINSVRGDTFDNSTSKKRYVRTTRLVQIRQCRFCRRAQYASIEVL